MLAGILAMTAIPVQAEQGLGAIGTCYAHCSNDTVADSLAVEILLVQEELFSYDEGFVDEGRITFGGELLVRGLELCLFVQAHLRSMENCAAGCQDLEDELGRPHYRNSRPRARFYHFLHRARALAQETGLYPNFRNAPYYQTHPREFGDGCQEFFIRSIDRKERALWYLEDHRYQYSRPEGPPQEGWPWRQ